MISVLLNCAVNESEIAVCAAEMNADVYDQLEEIMTSQELTVTDYSDASLSGTVEVTDEDQVLFLSVPYDDGWTITVDGEETDPIAFADAFILLELSEGTHEIAMHYVPPGFYAGAAISIVSVFLFFIICFFERRCYRVKSLVCVLEPADRKKDVHAPGHPDACDPYRDPAA